MTRWHLEAPHWRRIMGYETGAAASETPPSQDLITQHMDTNEQTPEPTPVDMAPGGEAALALAFGVVAYALTKMAE